MTSSTGRRLRAWLKAAQRSQRSLAKEIRVTPGYITHLITGTRTPSLTVAKKLQAVTGIPATDFVPPSSERKAS